MKRVFKCQALEQSCKIALPSNWPDMESVKIASYKNSEVSIDHQIPLPWFFSIIEAINSRTHSIKLTSRKPEEQEEETDLVTETGRAVSLKAQLFQKFIPRKFCPKRIQDSSLQNDGFRLLGVLPGTKRGMWWNLEILSTIWCLVSQRFFFLRKDCWPRVALKKHPSGQVFHYCRTEILAFLWDRSLS